jgi:hypothetical protein
MASDSDCLLASVFPCRFCHARTDEGAQRARKLGGPRRAIAGSCRAVPCRCVPSAGRWARSLVVRGKGLVVEKGDQLGGVEKDNNRGYSKCES